MFVIYLYSSNFEKCFQGQLQHAFLFSRLQHLGLLHFLCGYNSWFLIHVVKKLINVYIGRLSSPNAMSLVTILKLFWAGGPGNVGCWQIWLYGVDSVLNRPSHLHSLRFKTRWCGRNKHNLRINELIFKRMQVPVTMIV